MNNQWIILATSISGLSACLTSSDPVPLDPPGQVVINDHLLDAEHGWVTIADGVHRRIDPLTGTVSTVSTGEAGRRYDLDQAQAKLTLVKQRLEETPPDDGAAAALRNEIAELETTVTQLEAPSADLAVSGAAFAFDETSFCHNVKGMILASFETRPRSGGGVVGKVTSEVVAVPCIGFECIPFDDAYASGYRGGTYATARATNSGGLNTMGQYSDNGATVDMYTYPSATATVETRDIPDSSCSLRAGGRINTTLVSTPYQSCYLYKNFEVIRTCAQLP